MAIDTRNKRASACLPLMPFRALLPAPDGAIDQADRQQVVFVYGGILAGIPIPPTPPSVTIPTERIYDVPFEDRILLVAFEDRILEVKRDTQ